MAKWLIKKNAGDIKKLAERLNISSTMAQVLLNRDLRTLEECQTFLAPDEKVCFDIKTMSGVEEGFLLVKQALANRERIVIYGDYDVDGVMSTVILYKALQNAGGQVTYYIPSREAEGYGLNLQAVEKLKAMGTDLLITCDNGISAFSEIERAKELGIKVIVIDHHEPGFVEGKDGTRVDVIPKADVVIDPKQSHCGYPFKHMCAGGISYRFVKGFYEWLGQAFLLDDELICFACIATFCDVVDLKQENRFMAQKGLALINQKVVNKGLLALIQERGLAGKRIGSFEVGFILGPCINASGRLENASLAVELFLTGDGERARALSAKLRELNEERKSMTNQAVERIMVRITKEAQDHVLVVYDGEIHESIAGIVAGRVKDKLQHPVIVLTRGAECAKGSARSIEAYNIFEALYACRDLFERFGGHAMAAGLSIREEQIPLLHQRLNENCRLQPEDFTEILRIDKALGLHEATYELAKELLQLEPFGKNNKEPLFGIKNVEILELRIIEEKNTMIFTLAVSESFRKIKAVCFGMVEEFRQALQQYYDDYQIQKIWNGVLRTASIRLDLVYSLEINEFNGNVSVQLRIKDFRLCPPQPAN